jgi:transcriptional regulator with XRE-family HTH domain
MYRTAIQVTLSASNSIISFNSTSTLNDVVYGKSQNPTIRTIYYICFGLDIEMKDFFDSDLFQGIADND